MKNEHKITFKFGLKRYWKHLFIKNSWKRLISHISSYLTRKRLNKLIQQRKIESSSHTYDDAPKMGAILQFFNKGYNIEMLARGLKNGKFNEIIVLEDGSVDNSIIKWIDYLREPNNFIIRSNDLYEVITYNRALQFSEAEIVCLLQDDDELPSNDDWVKEAINHFQRDPQLLILGGHVSVEVLPRNDSDDTDLLSWTFEGDLEEIKGVFRQRHIRLSEHEKFKYVQCVVRSPVFIRRKEFLNIGAFDLDFAPFLCDDMDNCLRAWANGFRVGTYRVPIARDIGLGGMRAFNSEKLNKQVKINWNKIYNKHGTLIASNALESMIQQANDDFLTK